MRTAIQERVERARAIQASRFAGTTMLTNADMGPKELRQHAALDDAAEEQIAPAHVAEALQYRPWVAEGQNHSAKQASLPRRCKGK